MTFLDATIIAHALATAALFWQFTSILKPTKAGAVVYALAFVGWWVTLFVSAYRVGFYVGAP